MKIINYVWQNYNISCILQENEIFLIENFSIDPIIAYEYIINSYSLKIKNGVYWLLSDFIIFGTLFELVYA